MRLFLLLGALLSVAGTVFAAEAAPRDVAELSYERLPVQELSVRGALSFSKKGRFYPARLMSRGEAVTLAMSLRNAPFEAAAGTPSFIDVDAENKFFKAVEGAKKEGLLDALSTSKRFFPYRPIRTGEFAHLISKALAISPAVNLDETPADIDKAAPSAASFIFALENRLMPAGADFTKRQNAYLSRADAAQIAWRMLKHTEGAEFGKASWYGDGLSKIKPGNGVDLWQKKFTAAHKTLPMGTIVVVTNVWRGTSTEVVINDRGPFVEGRVVDLSRSGFGSIAPVDVGVMEVMVHIKK